jgi:hypothetical protein
MTILLSNQTENGDGPEVPWNGNQPGEIQIYGTFDGATVTVKLSLDGGVTFTAPPQGIGEFTAETVEPLNLNAPGIIRATVSNAGASTDLTAIVEPG